jgi:hypothetical protein
LVVSVRSAPISEIEVALRLILLFDVDLLAEALAHTDTPRVTLKTSRCEPRITRVIDACLQSDPTDSLRSVSVRNVLLRAPALMLTRPIDLSGKGI